MYIFGGSTSVWDVPNFRLDNHRQLFVMGREFSFRENRDSVILGEWDRETLDQVEDVV